MKILYLAPETTIFLNMSGGAGTHMRGTIDFLKKNNEVIEIIGGDLVNKKLTKATKAVKPISTSDFTVKKALYKCLKQITPKEVKLLINDIRIWRGNNKISKVADKIICNNDGIDIIYERSGYGYDTGYRLSKKYNLPLVLESDVTIIDLMRPRSSWLFNKLIFKKTEKKKINAANSLVVMSEPSIKLIKEIWEIKHNHVYFKGLGISKNEPKKQTDNENLDKKYNILNKFVVGYVGIFQDYQNIPILFEVAKNLKKYEDIVFLIVGTGTRLAEYKNYAIANNIENIIFTGIVDKNEINNYYQRIDLGIITDNAPHMYPVKYLEFISHNILTLIPNYEAFDVFFESELAKNHFAFTPNDHIDISNKILFLKKDYMQHQTHLEYSNSVVNNSFTWEKCSNRLEIALEDTLKRFRKN